MTAAPAPREGAGATARSSLRHELRTIMWLQWRLLRNAVVRRQRRGLGQVVFLGLILLLSTPYVAGGAVGLGVLLRMSDPSRVAAIVSTVFAVASLLWLTSPGASNQFIEGPHLDRLLVHPVSFLALVLGGLLASALSIIGLISLPFVLAVWLGASRDAFSAAAIPVPSLLFLAILVLLKALLADVFDLIAEDRRLRNLVMFLVFVPFFTIYIYGLGIQDIGRSHNAVPFANLLNLADLLRWVPPGWYGEAVRAAMEGAAGVWALACGGLAATVAAGLALHIRLQRLIYSGSLVRQSPTDQVASTPLRDRRALLGLSARDSVTLRALLRKDWLNLRRNPITPRLAFMPLLFMAVTFFMSRNSGAPAPALALGAGGMAALAVGSVALNSLALLDHRGLTTLLLSPAPRHLVLLSQGILLLTVATGIGVLLGLAVAAATGDPLAVPECAFAAFITQLAFGGVAHWTSVRLPYYIDPERGRASRSETSLFASLVLMLGLPLVNLPIYGALVLAWLFARPWLPAVVLTALTYALAVYAVTLHLATRTLARGEERLIKEIVEAR